MKIQQREVNCVERSEQVIDITIHTDKRIIIIPFPKEIIFKDEIESALDDTWISHTFEISGAYKGPDYKRIELKP